MCAKENTGFCIGLDETKKIKNNELENLFKDCQKLSGFVSFHPGPSR
jgi:hypothetical protein